MLDKGHHCIQRVLKTGFKATDIAEAFVSVDEKTPVKFAIEICNDHNYTVLGIRSDGIVSGYIARKQLAERELDEVCGDFAIPIEDVSIVDDTTAIQDVIIRLHNQPRVYVRMLGSVLGIITRHDLEKPPVRMWLFGIITVIELAFQRVIEEHFADEEWQTAMSATRIEKAKSLREERIRRKHGEPRLIDCIQLGDKGQIVAKIPELRDKIGFESRKRAEASIKRIEKLRNNLAHAQLFVEADWDFLVGMSARLELILEI